MKVERLIQLNKMTPSSEWTIFCIKLNILNIQLTCSDKKSTFFPAFFTISITSSEDKLEEVTLTDCPGRSISKPPTPLSVN